jgi:large subunit ribosomal protein LP2
MRHLAAYLLLVVGGNATPSAEDVKALLGMRFSYLRSRAYMIFKMHFILLFSLPETVGIESDSERLTSLLSELEGKDLAEVSLELNNFLYVSIISNIYSLSPSERRSLW